MFLRRVAKAYGYKTRTIRSNRNMRKTIREVLDSDAPVFCNVEIRPEHRVIPQVKFGRPIKDSERGLRAPAGAEGISCKHDRHTGRGLSEVRDFLGRRNVQIQKVIEEEWDKKSIY